LRQQRFCNYKDRNVHQGHQGEGFLDSDFQVYQGYGKGSWGHRGLRLQFAHQNEGCFVHLPREGIRGDDKRGGGDLLNEGFEFLVVGSEFFFAFFHDRKQFNDSFLDGLLVFLLEVIIIDVLSEFFEIRNGDMAWGIVDHMSQSTHQQENSLHNVHLVL